MNCNNFSEPVNIFHLMPLSGPIFYVSSESVLGQNNCKTNVIPITFHYTLNLVLITSFVDIYSLTFEYIINFAKKQKKTALLKHTFPLSAILEGHCHLIMGLAPW